MVTQPAYLRAFKAYTRVQYGDSEQVEEAVSDLSAESDRGAVIIAATGVEDILEWAIMQRMKPLWTDSDGRSAMFGANGTCSTFAGKILMAFALGAIDKGLRDQIDLVREIRNGCAHGRLPLSFDRPELQAICKVVIGPEMLAAIKDHKPRTIRDAFVVTTAAIQQSVISGRRVTTEEAYRMHMSGGLGGQS